MWYKLIISYDGTNYSGFQKQIDKVTIQETLEKVLSQVLQNTISISASGRTDAGVSAFAQVCHFDIENKIVEHKTLSYANVLLPKDIRIISIEEVSESFHARKSAISKTYEYYFYTGSESPIYDKYATFIGYPLNINDMKKSCDCFIGTKDFSAFCASNTSVVDKTRTIYSANILELDNNLYKFVISGNGFLYNMVRIIMGTLVGVGIGKIQVSNLEQIILSCDRSKAGKTMPSKGLYLKKVEY